MKKKIRLTESQFDNVIQYKLLNEVRRRYKPHWTKGDQILALYNAKYGIEGIYGAGNEEQLANNIIGTSLASFKMQTANFLSKITNGEFGLTRGSEHYLQSEVYDEYGKTPKEELRNIAIDYIQSQEENESDAVKSVKAAKKEDRLNAAKKRAWDLQIQLGDLYGTKMYPRPPGYKEKYHTFIEPIRKDMEQIKKRKLKPEVPVLPFEPEVKEPEVMKPEISEPEVKEQTQKKQEVTKYLKSIQKRMQNATTPEEMKKLSDEIEFIIDVIDMDLTDKEQQMVAEMKEFIKKKNLLIESEARKKIERIKKLNNIL